MGSIGNYTKQGSNRLVVADGYAVKAHLGGKITRVHGDIDCVFLNLSNLPFDDILSKVEVLLSSEDTMWKLQASKSEKVEWRENNHNISFSDRRRLELKIHQGDWTKSKYALKKLINSKGASINVYVEGIYPTLAKKNT